MESNANERDRFFDLQFFHPKKYMQYFTVYIINEAFETIFLLN